MLKIDLLLTLIFATKVTKLSFSSCRISSVNANDLSSVESLQIFKVLSHRISCKCFFCCLSCVESTTHWRFTQELLWIRLMFSKFDQIEFDDFRHKSNELKTIYSKEREKFWRSVTAKIDEKYEV